MAVFCWFAAFVNVTAFIAAVVDRKFTEMSWSLAMAVMCAYLALDWRR